MSNDNERDVDPIQEMLRLVQDFSGLNTWGFKESFRSVEKKKLIFDSEWCRINLVWGGWYYLEGNSISIYYGRLHAPNDSAKMIWNGNPCYCWHREELALHFLDDKTPEFAAKNMYVHDLTRPFYEPETTKIFHRRQPEWLLQMHTKIWDRYAPHLFEVFDLRRPDLWEAYSKFVNKVYLIEGHSPNIKPPMDSIC